MVFKKKSTIRTRRFQVISAAAAGAVAVIMLPTQEAKGQAFVSNPAGSHFWSNPSTWVGSVAPASNATNTIAFNITGNTAILSSADITTGTGTNSYVLNSLTFNNNSSALFTVTSGASFRFGGTSPQIVLNGTGSVNFGNTTATASVMIDTALASLTVTGTGSGTLTKSLHQRPIHHRPRYHRSHRQQRHLWFRCYNWGFSYNERQHPIAPQHFLHRR